MILIVDDRQENIVPLQKILALHGLTSHSASSGEEALLKILKHEYALIIMDVQMPGMDGFEVAETLAGSKKTRDIPVIFLSAINKDKKYVSKGYESGGVDYITKPVDPDLLIMKVKTFIKLHHQHSELKAIRDLLAKEIEIRKQAQENLEEKVQERTRELLKKNEELEFRNHELQQFSWVVSHDLKEPLRKIEIFSRMLMDRYPDDEKANHYLNRTIGSAERMSRLISDLLEYSRLSSDVKPVLTDLNPVIQEVLADLDYLIEEKNASVICEELPEVLCVPSQIRQVFQNLLSNSLKFTQSGQATKIHISYQRVNGKTIDAIEDPKGNYFKISVKDNGIGFSPKFLDKIFVIFQSLNGREEYEGTGIGLAIAKKIVEKHNGMITAISQPGQGAEFLVFLPDNTKPL
jgi:signal transduction histidine kinase